MANDSDFGVLVARTKLVTGAAGVDGGDVTSGNPLPVSGSFTISGSAGATGSAVPASAVYEGINVSGTLRGWTGTNPSGSIYAGQIDIAAVGGTALALGQAAMAASIPVVLSSNQTTIPVVGNSDVISVTPTVSTTPAYSIGDSIGGKLTFTSAARVSGGKVTMISLLITDKGNQKAPFDLLIFDSDPTNGTYTDNAAVVLGTDLAKIVARIQVLAADYVTVDSKAIAQPSVTIREIKTSGTANLYGAIVCQGTPTYASTTDLTIKPGFLQD